MSAAAIDLALAPTETGWRAWHSESLPVRLGVSSCLLGASVRYDGGHARDRFLADVLAPWVEWAPVCPEVELGLGTPRASLRLVDDGDGPRLQTRSTGEDHGEAVRELAERRDRELGALDGFVLKRASPSCALGRLRVYGADGEVRRRDGVGAFTQELRARRPELPMEEEGRLSDSGLREAFLERVFCRNRWRLLVHRGLSRERLVAFHTAHKMLLRSRDEAAYRRLGRIVGSIGRKPDAEVFEEYRAGFEACLRVRATRAKHVNVLEHALGYLKRSLGSPEKREALEAIRAYRRGLVPLAVPLAILRFSIVQHGVGYLIDQLYFEPHPEELMLRSHL